ncbi:MAG: DUF393 domain-containing protein [Flavobacteriia bacterium]|nr:DUF393 domain-containing protein [Flavobacteriia bacterium]
MKTLKNYKLIYDDQCPLCKTYSKTFVMTGLLTKEGREGYQKMEEKTCLLIDKQRACNEIALVNMETTEVIYGIDSIIYIIAFRFKLLNQILHAKPIHYLLQKLYLCISYNRKIIMPSNSKTDTCTPDFNIKYRIIYLICTWLFTSFILYKYSFHLEKWVPKSTFGREFFICGGQLIFQTLVLIKYSKERIFNYLGNMMTISFAGAILLTIGIAFSKLCNITNGNYFITFFFTIVILMLFEHIRRNKKLNLNYSPTITWTIYRLLIVSIIGYE